MVVINNKKRVITIGTDLIPGVNNLIGKKLDAFKKEAETAKRYDDLGIISVKMDKNNKKEEKPLSNVLDLPAKEALKLVKKCYDVKELESMYDSESEGKDRSSLLLAIEKQMNELSKPDKKDENK